MLAYSGGKVQSRFYPGDLVTPYGRPGDSFRIRETPRIIRETLRIIRESWHVCRNRVDYEKDKRTWQTWNEKAWYRNSQNGEGKKKKTT